MARILFGVRDEVLLKLEDCARTRRIGKALEAKCNLIADGANLDMLWKSTVEASKNFSTFRKFAYIAAAEVRRYLPNLTRGRHTRLRRICTTFKLMSKTPTVSSASAAGTTAPTPLHYGDWPVRLRTLPRGARPDGLRTNEARHEPDSSTGESGCWACRRW